MNEKPLRKLVKIESGIIRHKWKKQNNNKENKKMSYLFEV